MKSSDYFQDKSINAILESEMSGQDYIRKLEAVYDYSIIAIQKEIDAFFGKYAKKNKVTLVEVRKRLTGVEHKSFEIQLKEWYALANELGLDASYKNHLKNMASRVYISRLDALLESITWQLEKLAYNKNTGFYEVGFDNYIAMYYKQQYIISSGVEVGVKFSSVDLAGISKAISIPRDGRNFSDVIWDDKIKLNKTLNKLLPQSFSAGFSNEQIARLLQKEMGVSLKNAKAMVRTEINHICNQADLAVYKAVGIEEYEYLATLDALTSDICRALDSKHFRVTLAVAGINYPPMHTNCRSTTTIYIKNPEDLERVARDSDGKTIYVDGEMTQEEWVRKYVPKEQQSRLLRFMTKYKFED